MIGLVEAARFAALGVAALAAQLGHDAPSASSTALAERGQDAGW